MNPQTPSYEIKLLSSLAKVFPDETPVYQPECLLLSTLKGETVSFQAACTASGTFFKTAAEVVIPAQTLHPGAQCTECSRGARLQSGDRRQLS